MPQEGELQSGAKTDPQRPTQLVTQRPQGPHHQYTQAGRYPENYPTVLAAAQGRTQSQVRDDQQGIPSTQPQCSKAQDVYRPSLHKETPSIAQLVAVQLNSKGHVDDAAVLARDKEELERLSAGLLARLSALVLRSAGFPPREGATALDFDWSVAVRRGAKPPVTKVGGDATACSNPSRWSSGKQGIT